MSLVNDLLIEVDRRQQQTPEKASSPFDGLTPRRRKNRQSIVLLPLAVSAGAVLMISIALYPGPSDTNNVPEYSDSMLDPPSVSARPTASVGINMHVKNSTSEPEFAPGLQIQQIFERPTMIHWVALSKNADTTRLRIAMNQPTAYRIQPTDDKRRFEVLLEAVALKTPISSLDLLDTPIRSIQTHADGSDLRLSIALDSIVHIHSEWTEHEDEAVLVIDLQNSETHTKSKVRHENEPASTRIEERTINRIEANVQPDLPTDATEIQITRSANDQRRLDQKAARSRARDDLEAARLARAKGELVQANRLYASAEKTLPGYRDAILERATLLAKMDRMPDAIELIMNSRRKSPRDTGLAMLHARLIAQTGDLAAAVQILDQSGFSLTQAPDIHALAAALLQQAGSHEHAIERYETVLRRYPNDPSWWMGLGISLEAMDRTAEAVDAYRIAMRIGELPGQTRRWVSARVVALHEED